MLGVADSVASAWRQAVLEVAYSFDLEIFGNLQVLEGEIQTDSEPATFGATIPQGTLLDVDRCHVNRLSKSIHLLMVAQCFLHVACSVVSVPALRTGQANPLSLP